MLLSVVSVKCDDVLYRLYDVSLQQALPADSPAVNAYTIEQCMCPPTYTGLSCQVSSFVSYRHRHRHLYS